VNEYGAQSIPSDPVFLEELTESAGAWPELDWDIVKQRYLADTRLLLQRVPVDNQADLASYADETQRYQAELLQFYHKYRPCGGAVLFQFADAMPLVSWSILDVKRQPKLAYQITRRAMQPVQVMINWPKDYFSPGERWSTPVFIVNDLFRPLPAMGLTWQLKSGDQVLSRERGVAEAAADAVTRVATITLPIPEDIGEIRCLTLELALTLPDNRTIINEYNIRVKP
jgi:hypothetical protein